VRKPRSVGKQRAYWCPLTDRQLGKDKDFKKFIVALVFIPTIVNAASAESHERLSEFRAKCTDYGFAPGTDAFSACIQKLDMDAQRDVQRAQQDPCVNVRRQADNWCSEAPQKQGLKAMVAFNCSSLMATLGQNCRPKELVEESAASRRNRE
jgi:hypothetical protein